MQKSWTRAAAVLVIGLSAILLPGCQTSPLPDINDTTAVCQALVGPIKYNTAKKISRRYAGDLLALDLKQRNQVGQALHCPQYR